MATPFTLTVQTTDKFLNLLLIPFPYSLNYRISGIFHQELWISRIVKAEILFLTGWFFSWLITEEGDNFKEKDYLG